jgi:Flp pilus assembly pilin Flp
MELLKRLVVEEEGQGLVEYTLIVLLVALVFWVAVRGANVDDALTSSWSSVTECLTSPFDCASAS